MSNKQIIGFLILVILSASIYVMIPDKVRIDVENTRTVFKVWNGTWDVSGIEYTKIFDGTTLMRANSRDVSSFVEGKKTVIQRKSLYKDNISIVDYYEFDGSVEDVELFPVKHTITATNAQGKILVYEVQKLVYAGQTINGVKSPQSFGKRMKVEWEEGNYYSQIYKYSGKNEGKLTIKYRIDSNDFSKNVRLFDPAPVTNFYSPDNATTATFTVDFVFNFTDDTALTNSTLYLWNSTGSQINVSTNPCYQESFNVTNQTGLDGDCLLAYTGNIINDSSQFVGERGCVNGCGTPQYIGNLHDGDNSTGTFAGSGSNLTIWMNYTKIPGVVNGTWQVTTGHLLPTAATTSNVTINQSCFNYNANLLQFQVYIRGGSGGTAYIDLYCYNSSWILMDRKENGEDYPTFYEEAMWWIIPSKNVTGTADSKTWTNTFPSLGTYQWNAYTCDASECAFNATNRTITIGTFVPPTYSDNQTSTTHAGINSTFSLLVNDDIALQSNGYFIFSTNNSGTWVNDSAVYFTSTPQWANVTKILNTTVGTIVGYRWYLYDNEGNQNATFRSVKDSPTSGMLTNFGMTEFDATLVTNGVLDNAWHTDSSVEGNYFLIDLGIGNAKEYIEARIYSNGAYPGNYTIQYSDDNSSWSNATNNFSPDGADWHNITWSLKGSHRYWRFYLENTPGPGSWLQELEMYSAQPYVLTTTQGDLKNINMTLSNGINQFIFNVTNNIGTFQPTNQTESKGVINITNNYTGTVYISININETHSCITDYAHTIYNFSGASALTTTFRIINQSLGVNNSMFVWMWTRYNCSTNTSQWIPTINITARAL